MDMPKTLEVTYEDYTSLSGTSYLTLEETMNLFDRLIWKRGTFMYCPINFAGVFQVFFHDPSRLILEITNDSDDMIFHQKYASEGECKALIEVFFTTGKLDLANGFFKIRINNET